jgi:branched-chain amino acid aminotransferase/para-aminobenzoate synthetase component 1
MIAAPEFIWLNDELIPSSEARVSVHDRGLLYGDGFFETIRAENGLPWFLAEHLERLKSAAQAFRIPFPQSIDWGERLERLLAANGLTVRLAAVKILLTRGQAVDLGLPAGSRATLIIYARPYTPPSAEEYAAGWPVAIFPEARSTFLGRYKSLNYLFYLAARQYALDRYAREALILECDGLVSEGAATSMVFARGSRYFTPQAPSALAGVTLAVLGRALLRRNIGLEARPTKPAELRQADGLWVVNSLMGVMPVAAVDGQPVRLAPQATDFLQECLTSEANL